MAETKRQGGKVPASFAPAGSSEEKLSDADQKWVDKGVNADEKRKRAELVGWMIAFNGELGVTVSGVAKSYIPKKAYNQRVEGMTGIAHQVTECALNFKALDKGAGGVFGALLRWRLRNEMVPQRENVVTRIDPENVPQDIKETVDEYISAFERVKDVAVNVVANANNFVALGGSLMMSVGHHFDAQNRKPQLALLSALGLKDDITDESIRKVFYLALHPLPLSVSEARRVEAASGDVEGYSEAVKIRARGVPAGYAVLSVCEAVVPDLKSEKYWAKMYARFGREFDELVSAVKAMAANPTAYHVLAVDFGAKRIAFDMETVKNAMVICAAYATAVVKGTVSEAASLKKFINSNSRQVQKWKIAMEKDAEKAVNSVDDLLE